MRLGIIALAATALLCSIGSASAQSATTGTGGTLCSDLLAMDTASQGAFIQGYQAATQDQLVSAGSGIGTTGMSSSSSALGGAAPAPTVGAGTLDTASIISNCTGAPTTPLSQVLLNPGVGTSSSSP